MRRFHPRGPVTDYFTMQVLMFGHHRIQFVQSEQPLSSAEFGDHHEEHATGWDADWIDLGGEG